MSTYKNLLKETLEILNDNNLKETDVLWVGNENIWFTWKQFKEISDFEYDAVHAIEEINEELMVVGQNWWLERREYDGTEWWEFKKLPQKGNRQDFSKSIVDKHQVKIR